MNQVFVNEAFSKAVDNYLKSSDNVQGVMYNSFMVVVIRMLVCMYSELDIVNPMVVGDTDLLYKNLTKFGYSKDSLNIFFSNLQLFYEIETTNESSDKKQKNPYFVMIQKDLVDMFIAKKLNFYLTEDEVREFYDLLYTPFSKNPLRVSYNFLASTINGNDVVSAIKPQAIMNGKTCFLLNLRCLTIARTIGVSIKAAPSLANKAAINAPKSTI